MKTRKVTRKTLDELAKVMPVLTEQEMSECIGGAVFINISNGEVLGRLGPSSIMRVCTPGEFQIYSFMDGMSGATAENMGTAFKDLSFTGTGSAGYQLMWQIVKRETGYAGAIQPETNGSVKYMEFHTDPIDNEKIKGFYYNPQSVYLNNYDTFRSMLFHEKTHYGKGGEGGGSGNKHTLDNPSEDVAYLAQCNEPGFLLLPKSFRIEVAKGWFDPTKTSYTKIEIANKTGVLTSDF